MVSEPADRREIDHDMHHDMPHDIVVIGGGNMGAALVAGMVAADPTAASRIAVVEVSPERRAELATILASVTVVDEVVAASTAVIAVKPPDAPAAAAAAVRAGARRVISIAAGVTLASLEAAVRDALSDAAAADSAPVAVLRAMPNTPALVGRGVSAICAGGGADADDVAEAHRILGSVGICVDLDEAHFDAITALSGSGPAYVFAMAEALVAAGIGAGLPAESVEPVVIELLAGSATLLAERGDPAGLREMVTSPNGTTAAGLAALGEHGFADAVAAAVAAAARRSAELAGG